MTYPYTIKKAGMVAKILKLAFRATRRAIYSHNGDGNSDVRAILENNTKDEITCAQEIAGLVKNEVCEY